MGLFSKWGKTPADEIFLCLLILASVFVILFLFSGKRFVSQKPRPRQNSIESTLRADLLLMLAAQRHALSGEKIIKSHRVEVPARATKEMRSALQSLNRSIEEQEAFVMQQRKRYLEMILQLEKRLRMDAEIENVKTD